MFPCTQLGGMNFGFPDCCKTPVPAPVPIPYPNLSTGMTATEFAPNVLIGYGPAHNLMSTPPVSMGDTPGVEMGLISQSIMNKTNRILCSFTTFIDNLPSVRMLDVTAHNGMPPNAPMGATLVPSQFTTLVLV